MKNKSQGEKPVLTTFTVMGSELLSTIRKWYFYIMPKKIWQNAKQQSKKVYWMLRII